MRIALAAAISLAGGCSAANADTRSRYERSIEWPLDRVSFLLFLGYAICLIYAAAWGWSLWRLNRRGSAER